MKNLRMLLPLLALLGWGQQGQAQCVSNIATPISCTVPAGAIQLTATQNIIIASGDYYYNGTAQISNIALTGGRLYYNSNALLDGLNQSGGTLIYTGTGSIQNANQNGGTVQACTGSDLTIKSNVGRGSFVVAANAKVTFYQGYSQSNNATFVNYGTTVFQDMLAIDSGTNTGPAFINLGTLTAMASSGVFLNGWGFVNMGTAAFGTLTVNGGTTTKACLAPCSVLSIGTFRTNDTPNSFDVQPTNAGFACVQIGNYGSFNSRLTASTKLSICKSQTVTTEERTKYGSAQITENCTGCPSTASCQNPLPVVLTSFTASAPTAPGAPVWVRWQTASEVNHQGFVVERSADGVTFTDRSALLPATGGQQRSAGYAWPDTDPQAGPNYYRLRLVPTTSGPAEWSPVAAVAVAESGKNWASAYPPDADHLRLEWLAPASGTDAALQLQLLDIQGRVCRQQTLAAATAGGTTLELAGLAPGLYWLRLQQGQRQQQLRFARP